MLLVHLSAIKEHKTCHPGLSVISAGFQFGLRSKSRIRSQLLAATVPICDGILAAALT